ncbi:hypothetical protein GA0061098_1004221 [Bradyrhizobium shewense]|uniref:Uncharacterized protein n=1 Tax=Bradyrhizobium shewense TaxID=1761772 RepID=A0A1C3VHN8_9BRAD|nr:hypothetical protein [Bradyrhizobium shewense]SCB27034.1 hypothetical protein GA0061098_1004221 [Bradyrhizobium shewense]
MRTARRDHSQDDGRRFGTLSRAVVSLAAALGLGLACPCFCLAQAEPEPSLSDYLPPSEPEVTRDEWRQRIEDARRRAKEVSRERRDHPELYKPIPEDTDLVATERLLRDDSLQRGDIVTTKKGMFVYQGRSDQPRRDQDFVPVNPKSMR